MEPVELLAPTVDKSQVPPLHQKRIVAFVNHFLISSCSFLNDFAASCESKFIILERKIQRLEASLTITESKLASIPADTINVKAETEKKENPDEPALPVEKYDVRQTEVTLENEPTPQPAIAEQLVRASEDVRYQKFFKMVRIGVPPNAVKIKMQAEGFDPAILDNPNFELPDGVKS